MDDRIKVVISAVLGLEIGMIHDEISPDTVEDWDSLKHMELIMALEEEFSVQFTDDEIMSMLSYRRILEVLERKMS